jgi:hypothetical protein
MAPQNWPKTVKMIRDELPKLLKSQQDVDELLAPDAVPYANLPQIVLDYPGFLRWLRDFAPDLVPALVTKMKKDPRSLRHEIDIYRHHKRGYEKWVTDLLDTDIRCRATGRALLKEIALAPSRIVSISPYLPDDEDDYNAAAKALDVEAATAVGMPVLDSDGQPDEGGGTGKGSDVEIDFSPELYSVFGGRGRSGGPRPTGPASRPDEVLCHELFHAGRDARGVRYHLGVNRDYNNEEEYLAVVITNIYLAEKKQTDLRASHHGHTVLKHPARFLDETHINLQPRVLLERLRLRQLTLFEALAQIGSDAAWFNPVRQYDAELKAAKRQPAAGRRP